MSVSRLALLTATLMACPALANSPRHMAIMLTPWLPPASPLLVPDKRQLFDVARDHVSSAHDYARSLETLRQLASIRRNRTVACGSRKAHDRHRAHRTSRNIAFAIFNSSPVVSGRQQMTLAATSYLTTVGAPGCRQGDHQDSPVRASNPSAWNTRISMPLNGRTSLTMPLLINYGVRDSAMPIEQGIAHAGCNEAGNDNVTSVISMRNHRCTPVRTHRAGLPLEEHSTHDGVIDQRRRSRHDGRRLGR